MYIYDIIYAWLILFHFIIIIIVIIRREIDMEVLISEFIALVIRTNEEEEDNLLDVLLQAQWSPSFFCYGS